MSCLKAIIETSCVSTTHRGTRAHVARVLGGVHGTRSTVLATASSARRLAASTNIALLALAHAGSWGAKAMAAALIGRAVKLALVCIVAHEVSVAVAQSGVSVAVTVAMAQRVAGAPEVASFSKEAGVVAVARAADFVALATVLIHDRM